MQCDIRRIDTGKQEETKVSWLWHSNPGHHLLYVDARQREHESMNSGVVLVAIVSNSVSKHLSLCRLAWHLHRLLRYEACWSVNMPVLDDEATRARTNRR